MAKYLILWESNTSKWPADPKESVPLMFKFQEMTKQGIKEGKIKDWGIFPSGNAGYGIGEGSAIDLIISAFQYSPYITFSVQEVLSIDDMAEVMKAMTP